MTMKRRVTLPPFHENQLIVVNNNARFKVVAAGRRFGKSRMALFICLDAAINFGLTVWWISPTYNNVNEHWRIATAMVGDLPSYKNVSQKYMEFHYKDKRGSLSFKSGDRPDNLRGAGIDLVVIDEAAFVPAILWEAVVRPSLSDRRGRAYLISTPNGVGNWFHNAYLRGIDPTNNDWQSFHFTTADNKSIPGIEDEVRQAKEELSDLRFREEYLAEFVDYAGGVFFNLEQAATITQILTSPAPDRIYSAGIDLGRRGDFTAINLMDITDRKDAFQVSLIRFQDVGFNIQTDRIRAILDLWDPITFMESNSISMPIVEELSKDHKINEVYMTNRVKGDLVESLSANLQKGRIRILSSDIPEGQIQLGEMQAYEMSRTPSGLIRYEAKHGWHDDTVVALMLATRGIKKKSSEMVGGESPFFR